MNDRLQIETIRLGYAASENPLRGSLDGNIYKGLIPAPNWTETVLKRNGSVYDTVGFMKKIIRDYGWQAKNIAPECRGENLYDTCKKVWNFLFRHIHYCEDTPNKEELRTFARTFAERGRGVDCDDFSIAAGSLLQCLGVPKFFIRIARYEGKDYFQHVYIVVPNGKNYITIDPVLDEYDAEKEPAEIKDFLVMDNKNLNGIDISVLGGIEDDTLNEISGILNGTDFKEVDDLNGTDEEAPDWKELGAIRSHLIRTRDLIRRRPEIIRESEHPENFLGMLDYALKYWDTDQRDKALGILATAEDQINQMEGLQGVPDGYENIDLFYGANPDGTYDVLGKAKKERKFFSHVKKAVRNAGQKVKKAAKKVGKGIIRYNPVTASIREAVLLALKVNLFKAASKFKWGYLTEAEAQAHGFDMSQWRKVKTALTRAENLFVRDLQGKPENFKRAILTGRAGGLSGADAGINGLGVAAAAAGTAAAVPFITTLLSFLKNIDFGKLMKNVNVSKLIKNKKQAEAPDDNTPDENGNEKSTLIPEPDNSAEAQQPANLLPKTADLETRSNNKEPEIKPEPTSNEKELPNVTVTAGKNGVTISENNPPDNNAGGGGSGGGSGSGGENNTTDTNTADGSDKGKDNLPAETNPKEVTTTAQNENPIMKGIDWAKKNPGYAIAITGTGVFLLYQMLKPKPKRSLSGVRRSGKKKKGKEKDHPPNSSHNKKGKGGSDNKKFIL